NLGASAGAISGLRYQNSLAGICTAPPENTYELGDVEFDPVNKADYERNVFNINAAAVTFIQERLRECRGKNAPLSKQACREYERLYRTPDEDVEYVDEQTGQKRKMKTKPIVRMAWVLPKIPTPVAQARCEVGFCYRHTLPHTLHLIVGSSSVYSYTFQLPNSSPIVSLDLTRAIAVTKTTKISFGRLGEITQIEVKKGHGDAATGVVTDGAEAVELALLPQAVINAYFTSLKGTTDIIANMFTSETTAINNRKQLIDAEVALANAKKSAAGGRPTPQSSVTDSRGFVLAASNAVPRPKTQLRDSGEGKDSQEHDAQAGQAPPVATGAGGTGVGPGGAIPKKE
ncbi:MAG TPA: hypothetical protein VH682_32220, partial [Gemmataceae bacterium]